MATKPAVLRSLAITLLAGSLAGCLPAQSYTVTFPARPGELDPLSVELVDETGLAVGVDVGGFEGVGLADIPGVRAIPAAPNDVAVDWMGGMCDERTVLTLVGLGEHLQLTIETEGADGCRLAGVSRTVQIRFRLPIDPSLIDIVEK